MTDKPRKETIIVITVELDLTVATTMEKVQAALDVELIAVRGRFLDLARKAFAKGQGSLL